MARVPYLTRREVAPEFHDLLDRDINLYKALLHSPGSARQFCALGMHIRHDMKLDPRLRELAILQVGYTARAPYEYAHHIEIGLQVGVSDSDIKAIALESAGKESKLAPLERAVLRAARELSAAPALTNATYAELAGALDKEAVVDLILTIAFYCGVVRVLGALEMDVEANCAHYLEQYPLPD